MLNWRKPLLNLYDDHIVHAKIPRHMEVLRNYHALPVAERVEVQRRCLTDLLRHAAVHVPYYGEVLRQHGVYRNGAVDLNRFRDVPFLTRDILFAQFEQLKSDDLASRAWLDNMSGGSTGTPVKFLQDDEYIAVGNATKMMHHGWGGKQEGEPHVVLWGSDRDIVQSSYSWRMRLSNFVRNYTFLNSFRMTPENKARYVETIRARRPTILEAYADSAYDLACYINSSGITIAGLRSVITSASPLHPFMREEIERAFGCPVLNRYGCREMGDIAGQRSPHGPLEVFTYTHLVEVLDQDGEPCRPGEEGDVFVTCLSNYPMPFIRYRIGDRAIVGELAPGAPASALSLQTIIGRDTDFFVREDGSTVTGYFFVHFLGIIHNKGWLKKTQIIQEDYNSIVIKAVVAETPTPAMLDEIRSSVRRVMGESCAVRFEYVDDIPPLPSGKYRYAISQVTRRGQLSPSITP